MSGVVPAILPSARASSVLARDIALGTLRGVSQMGISGKEGDLQGRGGPGVLQWCGPVSCLSLVTSLPPTPRKVTPVKLSVQHTERLEED